jgi:NAD(P)-dependent dehydrogenase (short-subunit alcohol dehydrogenase family)
MDECAASTAARNAIVAGTEPLALYGSAKHALNRWCRKLAVTPQWAGAGIALNVVAPGIIDTPAAAHILSNPNNREQMGRMVPLHGAYPGRADHIAGIVAWCVSSENSLMTGQILFADGGFECRVRGEHF